MPNNYFQFKQFIIYQDNCAMKVTTDGCLLGAYTADKIKNSTLKTKHCLDIGAGTGLLSLMLAQKINAEINSVEIDTSSYLQAKENFAQSPWKEKLTIFNTDILQFIPGKKYDCIISNPPFFENDLKSPRLIKNKAKHDTSLTLQQLLKVIDTNLTDDGDFFVLLPYHRSDFFEKEVKYLQFHLAEKLLVKQTINHDFFRVIFHFSRKQRLAKNTELAIKDNEGNYTESFSTLLKDYYLLA